MKVARAVPLGTHAVFFCAANSSHVHACLPTITRPEFGKRGVVMSLTACRAELMKKKPMYTSESPATTSDCAQLYCPAYCFSTALSVGFSVGRGVAGVVVGGVHPSVVPLGSRCVNVAPEWCAIHAERSLKRPFHWSAFCRTPAPSVMSR